MLKFESRAKKEFLARMISDIGKTILAVGLASYFFEKSSLAVKIILTTLCISALIGSFILQPDKTTGE